MKVNWKSVKRGGCSRPSLQRPQHRNLLRGWSRRERQACRHSHSSPEGFSGRPPLQSLPRLSRCRDSRPSRPPLGSQELSLLRCQGMAEGNRLPSLENAPHLKTDGEFFVYHHNGVPTIITNSYTVFYCASSWEYFECWLLYSGTISFIFFTIAMSS